MGIEELSEDRRAAIAISVLGNGYTRGEIMLAAKELCQDPELDEKLRYGGALTAADFTRQIESDDSMTSAGKLYTYWEAREYWNRMGEPGTFPDSLFEPVQIDGETKYKLR